MDLKRHKLRNLCVKIGSGATPKGGKERYLSDGEIALIRSQNVLDFSFSYDGIAYISDQQARKLSNVVVEEEDVLLNITGDSVARVCQVPTHLLPARVNQHVAIIRPKKELLDNAYLKYYLLTPAFKSFMLGLSSVGGTRNALTKGMIEDFEISIPDLVTQKKIAFILSSLDDKIELNWQTNASLEAIAQALFKEWFVDFNYPGATGEMVESELGLIPEGWNIVTLSDFISIKHGYAFKGEFFCDEETNYVLVTPGNFRIGGGFNYTKYKYYNGPVSTDYVLNHQDLIVTMTDLSKEGDTLGYPALTPIVDSKLLLHNQRIGKIEFKTSFRFRFYFYGLMRQSSYRNYVLSGVSGSTVKHTSPSKICSYQFPLPTDELVRQYEVMAEILQNQLEANNQQNQTLTQLRDGLLPRLMRGKLTETT